MKVIGDGINRWSWFTKNKFKGVGLGGFFGYGGGDSLDAVLDWLDAAFDFFDAVLDFLDVIAV